MDDDFQANDLPSEDVVIFVAEGILCERLAVSIDAAVVALADMAVRRGVSLVEMARHVVTGAVDPISSTGAHPAAQEQLADPDGR